MDKIRNASNYMDNFLLYFLAFRFFFQHFTRCEEKVQCKYGGIYIDTGDKMVC